MVDIPTKPISQFTAAQLRDFREGFQQGARGGSAKIGSPFFQRGFQEGRSNLRGEIRARTDVPIPISRRAFQPTPEAERRMQTLLPSDRADLLPRVTARQVRESGLTRRALQERIIRERPKTVQTTAQAIRRQSIGGFTRQPTRLELEELRLSEQRPTQERFSVFFLPTRVETRTPSMLEAERMQSLRPQPSRFDILDELVGRRIVTPVRERVKKVVESRKERLSPERRRQISELVKVGKRIVSPLGQEFVPGPGGLVFERTDLSETELRRLELARTIPSGVEIFAFAGRRPSLPKIRGEARIIPRKGGRTFDVSLVTTADVDFIPGLTTSASDIRSITLSSQLARDVGERISVGSGKALTITKTPRVTEITETGLFGAAERVGKARAVSRIPGVIPGTEVRISAEVGEGFVSRVAAKDISRTRFRRGLRVGVRPFEKLPVKDIITEQTVTGFIRPTQRADITQFIGSTRATTARVGNRITRIEGKPIPRITTISKRRIARISSIPEIEVDIRFRKFPSAIETGRGQILTQTQARLQRRIARQIAPDISAQALQTSREVQRSITRSTISKARPISISAPTKQLRVPTARLQQVQVPIARQRVPVTRQAVVSRQLQAPRVTQAAAQSQKELQRQRQRLRQVESQRQRQLLRQSQFEKQRLKLS